MDWAMSHNTFKHSISRRSEFCSFIVLLFQSLLPVTLLLLWLPVLKSEPLDDFDSFESLVHVAKRQVETEVHHRGLRRALGLLQTHKVAVNSLYDHRLRRSTVRRHCRLISCLHQIDLNTNSDEIEPRGRSEL